jgi:uncharacterized protein (TIGR02231 family)
MRAIPASLALWATAFAAQASIAPVTAVTVYPGSATVTRSVTVAAGLSQVEIGGLPAAFDPATLRVDAAPGIDVGQVQVREHAGTASPNPREAALAAQIEDLGDRKAALDAQAAAAGVVRDYLRHVAEGPGSAVPDDRRRPATTDAATVANMVRTLRGGAAEAYGFLQQVEVQKRDLDRRIAALQRELETLRSGSTDTRSVTIAYSATTGGILRVSYQVAGAGWQPAYRAALDSAAGKLLLQRRASVRQSTGEDWSGVRLRLSTGQPRSTPEGPVPSTWLLTMNEPLRQYREDKATATGIAGNFAADRLSAAAPALSEPAAAPAPVMEIDTPFTAEFDVPGAVDLPADGRTVELTLSSVNLAVRERVRVSPRLEPTAYLVAEAATPDGVWLPGPVQLVRDGSYVGAAAWNPLASERLELPFGRDDLVRVQVKRTRDLRQAPGINSAYRERGREVEDLFSIQSLHATPIELLVLDAAPVAGHSDIGAQTEFAPQPTLKEWDHRQGVAGWEKTLGPRESFVVQAHTTIRFPKDRELVGLP